MNQIKVDNAMKEIVSTLGNDAGMYGSAALIVNK